jgi:methylglutaconyl-CoA hydratase
VARTTAPTRRTRKVRQPASYTGLALELRGAIAWVTLLRPDVHNAFDETLIAELTAALQAIAAMPAVRVLVLAGAGPSFCAGADLRWMQRMAGYTRAQNLADAKALARMLSLLDALPMPTIARVHGSVFGGGVGLVACCDIAVGAQDAVFALSEARLGLIPATVGPYVVRAIGTRLARRYFLTGERFGGDEAYRVGLLHEVALAVELDTRVARVIDALLRAGPRAQAECKALIRAVGARPIGAAVVADTARRIARVRASPEGREGVAAFLAKRAPGWVPAKG